MKMSLDYALFSESQLEIANAHFTKTAWKLAAFLQLNFKTETGGIFQHRPTQIAKEIGVKPAQIYGAIAVLNDSGYAELQIKNKKVCGRLNHIAVDALKALQAATEKDDVDQMEIEELVNDELVASMIDNNAIKLLIDRDASASAWSLAVYLPLYCDLKTGTVFEKRPERIAELLGKHRTTIERNLKYLNEIGYCQIQRDYIISGTLPYTAYAYNQNLLKKEAQAAVKNGSPYYAEKITNAYVRCSSLLKKAYGIVTETLSRAEIVELANLLEKKWLPSHTAQQAAKNHFKKRGRNDAGNTPTQTFAQTLGLPFSEEPTPNSA